jgi:creatinine amidohydrolase
LDTKSIRISDLTWPEYAARISDQSVVLLPVGALEQHGLHLPLSTDAIIAERLTEQLAARIDGIVLPTLTYGARSLARSGGGEQFSGTVNLDGSTLIALTRDIIREQARHGVTRFLALLGHGENDHFVAEGAELARRDPLASNMRILVMGWWQVLTTNDLTPLFPDAFPGWDREHAARVETALMMALAPDQVRLDRIGPVDAAIVPPYVMLPTPNGHVPEQGSLADPRGATAELGKGLAKIIVDRAAEIVRREFSLGNS